MVRNPIKPEVDPLLLPSLGQLTVNFNMLEMTISFFIWELIGPDQRAGQIVTAEMSFRSLIDLLCSLYRHHISHRSKLIRLDELRKRIEAAADKRNAFLHSEWWGGGRGTLGKFWRFKYTAKGKHGFKFVSETLKVEDVNAVADEIAILTRDVTNLMIQTLSPQAEESS